MARPAGPPSFAVVAADAVASLLRVYYAGEGRWRDCADQRCLVHNGDWGSDALTNTLYLHWKTTRDASALPVLSALARSEALYETPCRAGDGCTLWSDVPMWDAVAALREHEALPADPIPLQKAVAAFWAVEGSPVYGHGACPAISYQQPFGRTDHLKTLETDSNGIKAALLLYDATHDPRYLRSARARYRAVRRYFLDARLPLYSVYVFDDGKQCRQVPHRFFASVNGNMIWNGLRLARASGDSRYRAEALATADAVAASLSDPNGIFSDLQAENDLAEPLVEAMFELATSEHRTFARHWLIENARAAYSARRDDGSYGRFFDGPPPAAAATAWQTSGGYSAAIVTGALAPHETVRAPAWSDAVFVAREIKAAPASIRFRASGIALIGTLGERCCQSGHARVVIDGIETINRIGVWQNKSSSGLTFPNAILFAWRWRTVGPHEITLLPGTYDAKEGGSFVHLTSYVLVGGEAKPR